MRRLPLLFALALLAIAPLGAGRATTLVALDWPELLQNSTVAGVGEVLSVDVRSVNGRTWTEAQVQLTRTLKGAAPGTVVTLFLPGGVGAGEMAQLVAGTPRLQVGDRRLFFLTTGPGGRLRVVGLEQGAAAVEIDPSAPGGWVVHRQLTAHHLGLPLPG